MDNAIQKMLEINTKLERGNVTKRASNGGTRVATEKDLDRLIESYDNAVYGPVAEPVLKQGEQPKYNAMEEMKRLREIEENGGRGTVDLEGRNIPRSIVESILNNPLDLKPVVDPNMDKLEERLASKGIKAAVDVMKRVDKKEQEEKTRLMEQLLPNGSTSTSSIDYDALRTIVEQSVEKKLLEMKDTLNESRNSQQYVPSMKYLSFKDKFFFVDNDDNVFECVMKYKGKRKK